MERPSPDAWSRTKAIFVHPLALLALLILATLLDRSRALSTPISGVRPTQSAMIAGNLSRDLVEIGPKAIVYPRVDYAGDQPGYLLLEVPLVNLAGVAFEWAFDLPAETAYRLPSLLFLVAMQALLFAFVRARFGTVEAIASILLVSYFPVVVNQSVEVMPEQGAATAFMAGLYAFDRHLDAGRARHLIAATIAFALMLLIKSTSGLLLLVPLGLFQLRRGSLRELLRLRYALALAACVVPLLAWTSHAAAVNRASVLDTGIRVSEYVEGYIGQRGRWPLLASLETYANIARVMSAAYERVPLWLFAAGITYAFLRGGRNRVLLAYWLLAFLLFFVAVPFHASTHAYYTHGYAAFIALGGAILLGPIVRSSTQLVPPPGRAAARALLAGTALVFVVYSRSGHEPDFGLGDQRFGRAVKQVVTPRALGVVAARDIDSWDGVLLYVTDTRGWRRNSFSPGDARMASGLADLEVNATKRSEKFMQAVNERLARFAEAERLERRRPRPPMLTEEFVEEARRLGATFLAYRGPPEELAELLPDVFQRLNETYAVLARDPDWIVFSLEAPRR